MSDLIYVAIVAIPIVALILSISLVNTDKKENDNE